MNQLNTTTQNADIKHKVYSVFCFDFIKFKYHLAERVDDDNEWYCVKQ